VPSGSGGESGSDAGASGAGADGGDGGGDGGAGRTNDAGKGGSGGGGNSTSNGGEGGDTGAAAAGGEGGVVEPVVDTEPPYVVSVYPEDGTKGVRADTDIVITFNEPMDRVEAEKAYESARLPTSEVTFSWSSGGRVLTVRPNEPLSYGALMLPMSIAPLYEIAMTTVARDEAGNRLAEERLFSFTTLRKVSQSLTRVDTHRIKRFENGPDDATTACTSDSVVHIGDGGTNTGYGLLVSFSTLMTPGYELPEDLLTATFAFPASAPLVGLGALVAYRVRVPDPGLASWDLTGEEQVTLVSGVNNQWSGDVRAGLADDLAEREDDATQFYVRHELPTNSDETDQSLVISCASIRLTVTYLAP
jgi:hypothetical protein